MPFLIRLNWWEAWRMRTITTGRYWRRSCTLLIARVSSMSTARSWVTNCLWADLKLVRICRTQPNHHLLYLHAYTVSRDDSTTNCKYLNVHGVVCNSEKLEHFVKFSLQFSTWHQKLGRRDRLQGFWRGKNLFTMLKNSGERRWNTAFVYYTKKDFKF